MAEDAPTPSAPKKRGDDDDSGLPLGLILVGLLAAYGLLRPLQLDQVDVSFVFFDAQISLVVALLITAGSASRPATVREWRDRRRARRATP